MIMTKVQKALFGTSHKIKTTIKEVGSEFTFRAYLTTNEDKKRLSPWHDLPLKGLNSETD